MCMWFKTCAVLTSSKTSRTIQRSKSVLVSLCGKKWTLPFCDLPVAAALLVIWPRLGLPQARGFCFRPCWGATDLQKHLTRSLAPDSDQFILSLHLLAVTVPRQGLEAERCRLTCSLPFASLAASWPIGGAGHAWLNGRSSWTAGHTWDRQISSPLCVFAGVWTVHRNEQTSFHNLSNCSWKVFPLKQGKPDGYYTFAESLNYILYHISTK